MVTHYWTSQRSFTHWRIYWPWNNQSFSKTNSGPLDMRFAR